jgi:hypothetical protein
MKPSLLFPFIQSTCNWNPSFTKKRDLFRAAGKGPERHRKGRKSVGVVALRGLGVFSSNWRSERLWTEERWVVATCQSIDDRFPVSCYWNSVHGYICQGVMNAAQMLRCWRGRRHGRASEMSRMPNQLTIVLRWAPKQGRAVLMAVGGGCRRRVCCRWGEETGFERTDRSWGVEVGTTHWTRYRLRGRTPSRSGEGFQLGFAQKGPFVVGGQQSLRMGGGRGRRRR